MSWKTLRTHDHKYCLSSSGTELLFDLRDDPHELRNVANAPEHGDTLQALRRELLHRWFSVEKQYPQRTGRY